MRLYKYCVSARVDVLERNRIRFTQLEALNDPFEAAIPPYTKGRTPSGARTVLLKTPSEARADLIKMLISVPGVLCLTAKPDNLLMWAHYAEQHEGFVIGFDSRHAMFSQQRTQRDEFGYLREVSYPLERPLASERVGFFLTKSVEWAYEQEWRMFLPLDDAVEKKPALPPEQPFDIHLYPCPEDSIACVILGCRMRDGSAKRLQSILEQPRYRHVEVYRGSISPSEFKVSVDRI